MAKVVEQTNDFLVLKARTDASALGQLYEIYYERIFRFCIYRLFNKETAEDITSIVFLEVARQIRSFYGSTEQDFANWIYAIAANHANSYIRKNSRRKKLLEKAADSAELVSNENPIVDEEINWPSLYAAILKLKPKYQTIITLRYFENLSFGQIANILDIKEATLRVMTHRIINELRNQLSNVFDPEV